MPFDPARHHRRSIRLAGYDYTAPGAYFVTICAATRGRPFGTILHGDVVLSAVGRIVADGWAAIPRHHPGAAIDAFVVMPDHVHGIIWLGANAPVGAQHAAPLHDDGATGMAEGRGVPDDGATGMAEAPGPPADGATRDGAPGPPADGATCDGAPGPPADGATRDGAPGAAVGSGRPAVRPAGESAPAYVSPGSLGAIVRSFKSATTRAAHRLEGVARPTLWQRNYYERIVRDAAALARIRAYISANPARWRP